MAGLGKEGPQGEKLSWKGNNDFFFYGHRISLNGLDLKTVLQLQDSINSSGISVK